MYLSRESRPFRHRAGFFITTVGLVLTVGCATTMPVSPSATTVADNNPDRLLVVDCLLPSKIQQLGQKFTYLAPRRPVKTTGVDCEIRGGEYVAYDRSSYATALKVWLPKAQEGDAAAQTYVGEIYEKGLGIQADYGLAVHWYQKAAAQNYSRAMINLGYLYESGLGVPVDLTLAMNWYRKASGLTDAELEYVSSVERSQRQAAKAERVQLRTEVAQLQDELGQTRRALAAEQDRLSKERKEAMQLRATLKKHKQALAQVAASPQGGTPASAQTAEAEKLNQALSVARQEQQRLTRTLATAQLETRALKKSLGEAKLGQSSQLKAAQHRQKTLQAQLNQSRALQGELQQKLAAAQLENGHAGELKTQLAQAKARQAQLAEQFKASQTTRENLQAQLSVAQQGAASQGELQNQLVIATRQQQQLAQKLQRSRSEQNHLQQRLMQAEQANHGQDSRIAALEQALSEREQKIRISEQEIKKLEDSLRGSNSKLSEVQADKVVGTVAVGPSIEIIEPPLALMRSIPTATIRSSKHQVEVIGRVSPAEDLLTFKINGEKQKLEKNGVFQIPLPVNNPNTPVNIVAVDRAGKRSAMDFILVPKQPLSAEKKSASSTVKQRVNAKNIDFGNYYALVIGNQKYQNLTDLKTPVNDARAIADVLKHRYGFKTQLLMNANRYQLLSALNKLREDLTEKDNLLIYYAGHGELDPVNLRGYWLPVDAEPGNSANWISNVAITDLLNVMSAKHVLVVADSCYSGSLTRSAIARLQPGMSTDLRAKWYRTMSKTRARAVLTSGGVKPVLDAGGGEHSLFAKALLDALNSNHQILEGFQLYRAVQKRMKKATATLNVDQNPQYAPIKYAGHEAGEFFFLPSAGSQAAMDIPLLALNRQEAVRK